MEMTSNTRNLFRLIDQFDAVDLPDGRKLHLYEEDDLFRIQLGQCPLVATLMYMEYAALSVNLSMPGEEDHLIIHIPVGASDEYLKDVVHQVVFDHFLKQLN